MKTKAQAPTGKGVPPANESRPPPPRIVLAILGILFLLIVLAGYRFYRAQEREVRRHAELELLSIAQIKADQIRAWRAQRLAEGGVLMESPAFVEAVSRWMAKPETETVSYILSRAEAMVRYYHYQKVMLLDPAGTPRWSSDDALDPLHPAALTEVKRALAERRPALTEIHRDLKMGAAHLDVAVPLYLPSGDRTAVAVVLLVVDLDYYFFPFIQSWPVPSDSAETLLVRRDGGDTLFLNTLRFRKDAALKLRIPLTETNVPAVMAVRGRQGVVEGRDYRGVPVVSVISPIPDSPWFMVTKVDSAEVFAAWRARAVAILAVIGLLLMTVGALGGQFWRREQKKHYQAVSQARDALQESEGRLRLFIEHAPAALAMFDHDMRYVAVSRRWKTDYGLGDQDIVGRSHYEVFPEISEALKTLHRRGLAGEVLKSDEDRFDRADGSVQWVKWELRPWHDKAGAIGGIVLFSEDITERKRAERLQFMAAGVLNILNKSIPLREATADVLALIKGETGLDAAGIRLKQEEDFPYLGAEGFSEEFILAENSLVSRSADGGFCRDGNGQVCLECTCGLVLSEKCGPAGDSVTPAGSFWTGDAVSLAASLHENDPRRRPRDRCLHVGYQSVALIPIRVGGQIIGLLHLAGRRKGLFGADTVRFFEGLAASLGIAIARKQAEEQLRESRDRLDFALEKSHTGGWDLDLVDHTAIRSLEHDRIFGYPDILPKWTYEMFLEHVLPEDRDGVDQRFQDAIRAQKDWSFECRIRRRDGEIRWIWAIGGHQRDETGRTRRMAGIVQDITERKKTEERLRHLNEVLRAVRNVNQLITHEKDRDALLRQACAILTETRGFRSAWIALLDPAGGLRAAAESGMGEGFAAVREQMETGERPECCRQALARLEPVIMHNTEFNCVRCPVSHTYRDTAALAGPLRHGDRIFGVLVVALPKTMADDEQEQSLFKELSGDVGFTLHALEVEAERTAAVAALRSSEERYRDLVENLSDMVFTVSEDGLLTYVSPAAQALFGYSVDEATGQPFAGFIHPDDLPAVLASFANTLAGRYQPIEFRVRAKDGSLRWVRSSSRLRPGAGPGGGINGILSDVTERKQAEQALRDSEAFIKAVLDHLPVGVAVNSVDPAVTFSYMNDNFPRFYRTTREALSEPDGFWRAVYEDPEFRELMRRRVLEDCASGDPARMYWPDVPIARRGQETRYITARNIAVPGKPLAISTVWDVTERKKAEAEIRQLNTELEERVRLRTAQLESSNKELEAFAYSVSHDLRAPLRAIDGFSRIVMEDFAGKMDDEAVRLLNVVRENTRQMDRLITDLLALSRATRTEVRSVPVDMTGLARSVYQELIPPGEAARSEFIMSDLPAARGDPTLLRQVWFNLLGNALKYSASRDKRRIEVGAREENGQQVYFVKDNGVGFDPQYQAKLFGIFQRLHKTSEFEGSGIGLAIVQRIVQRHGGRVWAEGKVDGGATFYFALPRVTGDAATEARRPPEGMDIQ